ncbi:MAG: hypothetical protein PHW04_09705 [Candidatus Wallbacteria bacterium]|nr:hypothetical protein [Candidatus Wallbacteria bacterium]
MGSKKHNILNFLNSILVLIILVWAAILFFIPRESSVLWSFTYPLTGDDTLQTITVEINITSKYVISDQIPAFICINIQTPIIDTFEVTIQHTKFTATAPILVSSLHKEGTLFTGKYYGKILFTNPGLASLEGKLHSLYNKKPFEKEFRYFGQIETQRYMDYQMVHLTNILAALTLLTFGLTFLLAKQELREIVACIGCFSKISKSVYGYLISLFCKNKQKVKK